jgi:hypothetical protein
VTAGAQGAGDVTAVRPDAWTGGFCEPAVQPGPLDDAHLQQGLQARAASGGKVYGRRLVAGSAY